MIAASFALLLLLSLAVYLVMSAKTDGEMGQAVIGYFLIVISILGLALLWIISRLL